MPPVWLEPASLRPRVKPTMSILQAPKLHVKPIHVFGNLVLMLSDISSSPIQQAVQEKSNDYVECNDVTIPTNVYTNYQPISTSSLEEIENLVKKVGTAVILDSVEL